MKFALNTLLIWSWLAISLSGCGHFDSPVEIHLDSHSYRWGDRIRVKYDFEEPPPGVTVPVRILLVGYRLENAGKPDQRQVAAFEQSFCLILNQELPGITQTSLSSIEASLPNSAVGVPSIPGAPLPSVSPGLAPKIQWAIVSRAASTGEEDREYIDLR